MIVYIKPLCNSCSLSLLYWTRLLRIITNRISGDCISNRSVVWNLSYIRMEHVLVWASYTFKQTILVAKNVFAGCALGVSVQRHFFHGTSRASWEIRTKQIGCNALRRIFTAEKKVKKNLQGRLCVRDFRSGPIIRLYWYVQQDDRENFRVERW